MDSAYTPKAGAVVHQVDASLDSRFGLGVVHLVQYDDSTPVLAIRLQAASQPYAVPEGMAVNIRLKKPDGANVYNPALGLSEDRTCVYIEVTEQMTAAPGRARALVEITNAEETIGTASFMLEVDKNPIQSEEFHSGNEYKMLEDAVSNAAKSAQDAAASKEAAGTYAGEAAGSAAQAGQSASSAAGSAAATEESRVKAADSEAAAEKSAKAAAESETKAQGHAEAASGSATLAEKKAGEAEDWSNTSKSWAIGEGLGEKRPGEEEDNAKYYAGQARDSAESAAGSVRVLEDNQEAIQSIRDNLEDIRTVNTHMEAVETVSGQIETVQTVCENMADVQAVAGGLEEVRELNANMETVQTVSGQIQAVQAVSAGLDGIQTAVENLAAILAAPEAAERAEAADDDANLAAERAEEAANRAQSIAQGAKGYYETPETLRESVPEGTAGDWAIVGSTDTIWVWDKDTAGWKDTHQATDLSNYYTKDQADAELNELQTAISQATDGKLTELSGTLSGQISALEGTVSTGLAGKLDKTEAAAKVAKALSFTGGASGSYDGSEAVSVAIPAASATVPIAAGTASAGKETAFARGDHVHPAQTDITGNAATATQADHTKAALTFTGGATGSFNGATALSVAIPAASTTVPIAAGTASAGKETAFARGDHVHPAQTDITGNAATATKLAAGKAISISGGATAAAKSFDGSAAIDLAVTALDVSKATAGTLAVARGGTGATSAAEALSGLGGQPKHKTLSLTLAAATWSASNTYTITATGVTASNTVIVCPAPASFEAWGEAGVRCTAQGANSLTFTAAEKPSAALTAQVLILD